MVERRRRPGGSRGAQPRGNCAKTTLNFDVSIATVEAMAAVDMVGVVYVVDIIQRC